LREIGVVAPKVLERLNKIRNRIEHDYYCPTIEEANDFIDVVELFPYATLNFGSMGVAVIAPRSRYGDE